MLKFSWFHVLGANYLAFQNNRKCAADARVLFKIFFPYEKKINLACSQDNKTEFLVSMQKQVKIEAKNSEEIVY